MMVDMHLASQIRECFQLLGNCTELHKLDGGTYALAHENHPLAKWVRADLRNAAFCYKVAVACNNEQAHRKGKSLFDSFPFEEAYAYVAPALYEQPVTYPFCVPEYIRARLLPGYDLGSTPRVCESLSMAIKGYRAYYCMEKSRTMESFGWTNRQMPYWWLEYCNKVGRVPF
jgi:hypothetical protein